jgi:hypothetical protein
LPLASTPVRRRVKSLALAKKLSMAPRRKPCVCMGGRGGWSVEQVVEERGEEGDVEHVSCMGDRGSVKGTGRWRVHTHAGIQAHRTAPDHNHRLHPPIHV